MLVDPSPTILPERARRSDELNQALWWHGAWLLAVALAGIALAVELKGIPWTAAAALLLGAAPGAAGLLLKRSDTQKRRALLLAAWAGGGAAACMFAGGVSGPLAIWCLAPVGAAAVLGGASLLAEAAALTLVAAAVSALAGLTGLLVPAPPPAVGVWLGFIGLLTTSIGLGAGLLLASRRAGARAAVRRAAEADLERLLSGQPHLILALDAEGRIGAAYGLAPEGVSAEGLIGRAVADLAAPDDRPKLQIAIASGTGECAFAPSGAPERSCVIALRRSSDGRLTAALRDSTVQQAREVALETAREEAEALNAGKTRFLANMSHELRTPLNAIMGFSDVMRARLFGQLPPKYGEYAEMIHDAGRHLLDLINDVLDISKIEADRYELSREEFDAREAVSGALRLTRLQADDVGVSLRGLLPPQPLDVDADRRAVKQIVLNLVSNALKFTPRGGSVTVMAQSHDRDLEITVSDTGVGIAEADLERLGRPFEQAGDALQRARGAGLGLSLVRAFSELHGGSMSIESRLGEGTSVLVRLPVMASTSPERLPADRGNVIPLNAVSGRG
jgi:cell cycle sensor histidine kinase DivJ